MDIHRRRTLFIFLLIFSLSLILRFSSLFTSQRYGDSDEAVLGLMTIRIIEKGERPIFWYSLAYNGAGPCEAYLTVPLFKAFGISYTSLKLLSLILFHILLITNYFFVKKWFEEKVACLGSLLLVLAGPFVVWSTKARGGYMETLIVGILLASLAFSHLYNKEKWRHLAIAGFVSGISLYLQPLSIPALLLFFIFIVINDKRFIRSAKILVYFIFLLIGYSPAIYFNLTHNFENFAFIIRLLTEPGGTGAGEATDYLYFLQQLFSQILPRFFILDMDQPEGWEFSHQMGLSAPVPPLEAWAQFSIFLFVVLYCVFQWRGSVKKLFLPPSNMPLLMSSRDKGAYLLSHILIYLTAYLVLNANTLMPMERFLLPLYPSISILTSIVAVELSGKTAIRKSLSYTLLSVLLMVGLMLNINNIGKESRISGYNYKDRLTYKGYSIRGETVDKIVSFLEENGIQFAYSTYYLKYHLIFQSGERILVSSHLAPPQDKKWYPPYDMSIYVADKIALVFHKDSYLNQVWRSKLTKGNIGFKSISIDDVIIYYPIDAKTFRRLLSGHQL